MTGRSVYFTAPRDIEVREEPVPEPDAGEVRVRSIVSAVSPGTELLIYRGEADPDLPADETLDTLLGTLSFPLQYGYAVVGTVTATGDDVGERWLDTPVLAFHPHASHFAVPLADVVPLPEDLDPETAAFLPNVETAINFLLDGSPLIGERVAVFGQGVVGLLTTALLGRCPLDVLVTADLYGRRRRFSESLGADRSIDPKQTDPAEAFRDHTDARPGVQQTSDGGRRADLTYELSGNPDALNEAVDVTGYHGRVVIGSWYGTKQVSLDLAGRFHRSRIRLISSQVSTVDPTLRGRWSKPRRLMTAQRWLNRLDLDRLITHRIPIEDAPEAYELLDHRPEETVQVLFTYQ